MQTNFVNVRTAAAELGLSPRAVLHRIQTGTLTATKVGDGRTSSYVIDRAEIERVLAEREAVAGAFAADRKAGAVG